MRMAADERLAVTAGGLWGQLAASETIQNSWGCRIQTTPHTVEAVALGLVVGGMGLA